MNDVLCDLELPGDMELALTDSLVEDACPLHADVQIGDICALDDRDRLYLDALCNDLHFAMDHARSERDRGHADQVQAGLRAAERIRDRMTRVMSGEPEWDEGPSIDLWARS